MFRRITFLLLILACNALYARIVEVKGFRHTESFTDLSPGQAEQETVKLALEEIVRQKSGVSVTAFASQTLYDDGKISKDIFSKYSSIMTTGYVKKYSIVPDSKRTQLLENGVLTVSLALNATLDIPDDKDLIAINAKINSNSFKDGELASIRCTLSKKAYLSLIAISEQDSVYLLWNSDHPIKANKIINIPQENSEIVIEMVKSDQPIEYGAFCLLATDKPLFQYQVPPASMSISGLEILMKDRRLGSAFLPYCIE